MSTEGEAVDKPTKGRRKWKRSKESIERQKATVAKKRKEREAARESGAQSVQEAVILLRKALKEIRTRDEWNEGDLYTVLALRALGG